jgi:hypothetical protein
MEAASAVPAMKIALRRGKDNVKHGRNQVSTTVILMIR